MKMLCAVFKHAKYNTTFIAECDETGECFADRNPEYVRLSETIEVEFPELPKETIVAGQLAALDREKEVATAEYAEKLAEIMDKRALLMALPAPKQTREDERGWK